MAVVNTQDIMIEATKGKYAIAAFNITSVLQMEAVIEGAVELDSPVIIQTSVSPAKQTSPEVFGAAYQVLAKKAAVPVAIQLDHCTDPVFCFRCIEAGYTSVMIDASKHPFDENVRITKEVVQFAHKKGNISVEGELGTVGGVEDQIRVIESEIELCDPESAVKFVRDTDIDNLAPAIGTAHGIYKTRNPKIDTERFKRVAAAMITHNLEVPLVIHGGTGLPRNIVDDLVSSGGSKYNVSTELKHTWLDAAQDYFKNNPGKYDPVLCQKYQWEATKVSVAKWIEILGSKGKA